LAQVARESCPLLGPKGSSRQTAIGDTGQSGCCSCCRFFSRLRSPRLCFPPLAPGRVDQCHHGERRAQGHAQGEPQGQLQFFSSGGGTLAWNSAKLSPRKAVPSSINWRVGKPGTYNKFGFLPGASFVLETSNFTAWVVAKGTLTIMGKTGVAGSASVTLSEHEGTAKRTVYSKGSWNCA
jgi:hypothetical protein